MPVTLTGRLLLLMALAFLPALAVQAWTGVEQHQARSAALDAEAVADSRDIQADMTRLAESVRQLLVALAESPAIRAGDAASCTAYLQSVARQFGTYSVLAATDAAGGLLCNSAGNAAGSHSDVGRAYWQRATATGAFAVGDVVTSVTTHRPTMHFALPFRRLDGTAGGVVLASIDLGRLALQMAAEAHPRGAQILVLDPSGTVMVSLQDGRPAAGVGTPSPPSLRGALAVAAAAAVEAEGPDGKRRLYGAVPADPSLGGIVVAVGLDRQRAYADLRFAAGRNIAGILLGALLAACAAVAGSRRFVLGPLASLAAVAERVGQGDLRARADLGQRAGTVGEVGGAFNRMAAALALREGERDRAEAADRAGQARLAHLLAAIPAGVVEWDAEGQVVYANAAAGKAFRVAAAALVGRRLDDRAMQLSGPVASALAGQAVMDHELVLEAADGGRVVLLLDVVPERDEAGRVQRALGAFQDVTARHAASQALRESEARFRHMADSAPVLICMSGQDGAVTFVNMHHEWMFGLPRAALLGDGWDQVVLPEDLPAHKAAFRAALEARQPFHAEVRVRDKGGQVRVLRCEAVPRLDDAGRFLGYTGCKVDITEARLATDVLELRVAARTAALRDAVAALHGEALEREQAQAALRQAQKMEAVGQLTGGIAHDFNNMLQAIGGSLDLMQRRMGQGRTEDAARFVEEARKTVDRAASLTHRLLGFARRQALQAVPVEPNMLIENMAELIRRTAGPAVQVELRLAPRVWTVLCDPNQLENALLNLAINARDAMPQGGTLTLATQDVQLPEIGPESGVDQGGVNPQGSNPPGPGRQPAPPGGYVEVMVHDTGSGMDSATQQRAFEPFFTTKPLGQGTGLGLSQLYGFVQQSGGRIKLDSAPGQGTTVRMYLPRHEAGEALGAAAAPLAEETGAGGTIVLVEDEDSVRALVGERLRELGYQVLDAPDGPAALRLLHMDAPVDLLVTDVGLPGGLNGRQVADVAREARPQLPVLFMTGYAGTALDDGLAPGMQVIGKPFVLNALAAQVRVILEAPAGESLPGA